MEAGVRYRLARRSEPYEPYMFFVAWPYLFLGPYLGLWSWAVAFAPELLVMGLRYAWRKSSPRVATVQRGDRAVVLRSAEGEEMVAFAEIEAATSVADKQGCVTDLRIERKNRRALVIEVTGDATSSSIAQTLGIDAAKARSRFTIASLLAPRGALLMIVGFALIVWSQVGSPGPETARWILLYTRFVFMPLSVIYAVPAILDIGRDGVSWRWPFIRRYVPFAEVESVSSQPANVTAEKVATLVIRERFGRLHRLVLAKDGGAAWIAVREAFARSKSASETTVALDEHLTRGEGEEVGAWIRRLHATSAGEGYRAVSMAHLWSVV
ncbi:MAG TPA: hypothetical protein VLT33_37810, partial [Labilithrix sp.]|nr:hypothetical protein [Labilithrix sp.]